MQKVPCLDALKSDDGYAVRNLKKVLGEKPYLYYPASNFSDMGCISSESGPSKSTPGPVGLHMWEQDSRADDEDHSPPVNHSCDLRDVEALYSCWILRTLQKFTFGSIYGYENINRKYLYAPPSDISGFMDEVFTQSI